ncbi:MULTISPECIES: hypothetical protein [unclassified Lentimonas]|uniref:hypothetical protein n=1 Tax=unclassified Lentimonas TaxID=2630993 RepID=UPI001389CF72|nr:MULTISPECIES: hypothetical protein [unclassified Lentimonas]
MKRLQAFILSSVLAMVAFIPLCAGILNNVNDSRFGYFEYESFSDVEDSRVERYLPIRATQISIYKEPHSNGYRARYSISEPHFLAYIESLWNEYESTTDGEKLLESGSPASAEDIAHVFGDLDWKPPSNAMIYSSPSESDGGGAIYYIDPKAGVVFQQTGYW